MSDQRIINALRIILTSVSAISVANNIIEERFDMVLDVAPTGVPYLSASTRSQIECCMLCARDTNCMAVTTNRTDESRQTRCEMFTCLDARNMSQRTGMTSFKKMGPVDLSSTIISISVSTEQGSKTRDMVVDGVVTAKNGWSAASYTTPKWLRVDFDEVKVICHVDILARCGVDRQASGYALMYENGASQVSRSCSELNDQQDCPDTNWERYYLNQVFTSFLTISASAFCGNGYYYGIRELKVHGLRC